jgi:signal transduction histidine kinase/CheY-like chemotaxis protein/CHASE3 domain sensor protein
MQQSLKKNLRVGLGLSLTILFISSLASYISISNLIESSNLVAHSNTVIYKTNEIISSLKDAETGQRGYLLTGETVFLEPTKGARQVATGLINEVSAETRDNPFQQKNLKQLQQIVEKRLAYIDQTIVLKSRGGNVTVSQLLSGKQTMDTARKIIKTMQAEESRILQSRTDELNRFSNYTPILIVLAAIISLVITLVFYGKMSGDFSKRMELQRALQEKNEEVDRRIQVIQELASQISAGNYGIRLQADVTGLGKVAGSLNAMAESLQYSFALLADKEWQQAGIARLNDKMVGEKSVPDLSHDILENLVEHTSSQVAAMYLLEDKELHLVGNFGLESGKKIERIKVGEGLTGLTAQQGKQILLNEIPEGEFTISYATGSTIPKNVVAFPIFRNSNVVGVIELASLNTYTPLQLEFLTSVSNNIGIALHVSQNRKRIQEFLEETQAQTEELQAQHAELEGMNAELEAQSQKIQTSEEELRVQQEELLQSNQELEERTSLLEEKNQLIQDRNKDIQQKAEQLEQSTKYKSEFLANMSHELRTPLNSILLLSKLMSENQELDSEFIEYAEVIQSSGQGLLGLIDEILDLSKIEAGKMKLEFEDVYLTEVATDLRSLFMPLAKNKQLDLAISVEPALTTLNTDKMRLEQILKNLLSNAIKFTEKGQVSLNVYLDEKRPLVYFKVTDTGIGIPADKLSLVFEAFQQADGSTRRRFGGTGLGLSISRELAKLLGGVIELTSEENVGSAFVLILPLNKEEGITEEQRFVKAAEVHLVYPEAVPEPLPERFVVTHIPQEIADDRDTIGPEDKVILIVEDDTAFAKTLLDFTRKRNYKGIVAVRGDQGIALASQYKPLAILLDIQLPVKDGWQVMEELKSNPATRPIPVHIMSSLEVKKESLLRGAVDFINKPVALEHMRQIFQKLEDALSRHPKKVLIVEENRQHAEALSYFLSNYNIQTEVANNVSDSIGALSKKEVDCVILDMGVPDTGAYETLETIKKTPGLENLPIIIFTGKSISKGEEIRIKQYADSIVVKTAHSYQRILDEAGLFLHLVEESHLDQSDKKQVSERLGGLYEVLNNKTVLIADDDVRNIFSLTKALEQHKMKVLAATDGKEALQMLKDNPMVDVVLMDMMMPEMDGYESTREIRKIAAFKHLPILAVTAKAMMGDREKCIAAGASDYISKPVDIDQLISLLRVWLYDKV